MFSQYNVVSPDLEITDPTPNIYELFQSFNYMFFNKKLDSVAVQWNKSIKTCAGYCSYQPRSKFCEISLSESLLKLRPRRDLVETLLHEMIHAYLFVTENDLDRESHGPNFKRLMRNINEMTGANITVYHSFHNEVRHYKSNWYRCNGPCRHRKPLYGFVKGKLDRGPCNKDRWYAMHKATCGGFFIKTLKPPSKSLINKELCKNNNPKSKVKSIQTTLKKDNGNLILSKEENKENDFLFDKFKKIDNNDKKKTMSKNKDKKCDGKKPVSNTILNYKTSNEIMDNNHASNKKSVIPNDHLFSGLGAVLGTSNKNLSINGFNGNTPTSYTNTKENVGNDTILFNKVSENIVRTTNRIPSSSKLLSLNDGINNSAKTSFNYPEIKAVIEIQDQEVTDFEKAVQMSLKVKTIDLEHISFVECPSCPELILVSEINDHLDRCLF